MADKRVTYEEREQRKKRKQFETNVIIPLRKWNLKTPLIKIMSKNIDFADILFGYCDPMTLLMLSQTSYMLRTSLFTSPIFWRKRTLFMRSLKRLPIEFRCSLNDTLMVVCGITTHDVKKFFDKLSQKNIDLNHRTMLYVQTLSYGRLQISL